MTVRVRGVANQKIGVGKTSLSAYLGRPEIDLATQLRGRLEIVAVRCDELAEAVRNGVAVEDSLRRLAEWIRGEAKPKEVKTK